MARPRGVEPLTPRSVVWCSIQLSYGRLCHAAAGMPAARAGTITPALRLWQGHPGTFPGARSSGHLPGGKVTRAPSRGQGNPGKPHRDGLTIAADPLRWDRRGGLARERRAMADTATMSVPPPGTAPPADMAEADDPARRPVVTLLPGGHRRAEAGHPWIYSNEIAMDA